MNQCELMSLLTNLQPIYSEGGVVDVYFRAQSGSKIRLLKRSAYSQKRTFRVII